MKEYKFLEFNDDRKGKKEMQETIDSLTTDGWSIMKAEMVSGGWNLLKTIILGLLFLPLALFGKRKNKTKVTLERSKR